MRHRCAENKLDKRGATGKAEPIPEVSAFPVQHHPVACGSVPPHLRRAAFGNSPPESGGAGAVSAGVVSRAHKLGWGPLIQCTGHRRNPLGYARM